MTELEEFADCIEEVIRDAQNLPQDRQLRVHCMGKDGQDFRVGHIKITRSGVVVISGLDQDGNSVYAVSHYQRMQFVCEISKKDSNEKPQPIGFSREIS